jgi:hypothetical protein
MPINRFDKLSTASVAEGAETNATISVSHGCLRQEQASETVREI